MGKPAVPNVPQVSQHSPQEGDDQQRGDAAYEISPVPIASVAPSRRAEQDQAHHGHTNNRRKIVIVYSPPHSKSRW
jgi:hypothetical protein